MTTKTKLEILMGNINRYRITKTKVDLLIEKIKNNRWLSYLIVIGIVFLSIVSIAEGLNKAGKIFGHGYTTAKTNVLYDASTANEIIQLAKKLDLFYGNLLDTPDSKRQYENYKDIWVELETDLFGLYIVNRRKPLNHESTTISESILKLWIKYKDKHKTNNTYKTGNAKLDRNRFRRLFVSMAAAEEAKKLDDEELRNYLRAPE